MSEYIEGDDVQERDEMIDDRNTTSIEAIKARIAVINSLPLDERSAEYEAVHASLQRALAEIDGI